LPVPTVVLGTPINRNVNVDLRLTNQLTKYFGVTYGEFRGRAQDLRDRVDMGTLVRYGRFRLASDGDKIRAANLIARDSSARDNSFVRVSPSLFINLTQFASLTSQFYQYDLLPDANANYGNRPDEPVRVTHYAQLLDIYYVEFIEDPE
jgi:hypothetical protein